MLNKVKQLYSKYPPYVWIIGALILIFVIYWFSGSISNWYEKRMQSRFDTRIETLQRDIDILVVQRDEALQKASEAEAREQAKQLEVELLRTEIDKHGINIEKAQEKIEEATQEYLKDLEFVEKIKTGEITSLQLCEKQCADSKLIGYPCRANYCDQFK